MNSKRVCLVIPSLQAGGMERVMSELVTYLCKKPDLMVFLVLYGIKPELFYKVPDNLIIQKPPFIFDNRKRLLFTLKTVIYLRKTIKRISPYTVLSFGEYWNNFVLISMLGLKYPVFVSDRSQPDKSLGWIQNKLRHYLYPRSKGLILQTEKAREIYLLRNKHSNIAVIGNPINSIVSAPSVWEREKIVLMVGRLIKTKNQDKLIEMFAKINLPDWKLVLVGYDHLKQHNMVSLKDLVRNLNVEQRVVFAGKQTELAPFYSKSSVFAFTSSSEGFPNVIGEAMSAGLAVVAFDCVAGPSEMITDGYNGYLIPLYDYNLFQARLEELMTDEKLRIRFGSSANESIKKFSSEKICESFYKFITQ